MNKLFILITMGFFGISTWAQQGTPTRPAGQPVQNAASSSDEEAPANNSKFPVSTGKYITGGVLGSTIGFGIGHAVQGRYGERGWLFTMTEAVGTGMMILGCNDRKDRDGDGEKECNNKGLVAAGLVVAIGFHIWEIVDVWTTARPVETEPTVYLIPDPKAPSLGLAWRF
jgi:hypothetical protein